MTEAAYRVLTAGRLAVDREALGDG